MEKRNIFEFATKELSQDAFLSWFIANCNDPDISEHAYNFINLITGWHFNIGDIKEVEIKQQENNIDVIVDFWTKEKSDLSSHYVIIIEDKTASSAHSSQLKRYAHEMDKWNNEEPDYKNRRRKVFYKTGYRTDEDAKEIEAGNMDKNNQPYDKGDCWRPFYIDEINDFFSKIETSRSQILSSYVEHISKVYKDLTEVSNESIDKWNYANWQTFFGKRIKEKFSYSKSSWHFETWQFQGRLVSAAFYRHPNDKTLNARITKDYPCIAYPLVEFVIRKHSKVILIHTHIDYHWEKDSWSWKISEYAPEYEPNKEKAKGFIEAIRKALGGRLGIKTRNMGSNRDQTISSERVDIPANADELEAVVTDKLKEYFEVFASVDTDAQNENTSITE